MTDDQDARSAAGQEKIRLADEALARGDNELAAALIEIAYNLLDRDLWHRWGDPLDGDFCWKY